MDVQLVKTPVIVLSVLQHTQRRLALGETEQKIFQKRSGCCQLQIPFLSIFLSPEIFISQEFLRTEGLHTLQVILSKSFFKQAFPKY